MTDIFTCLQTLIQVIMYVYEHKALSNICMKFYFPEINDEQLSTMNGLHKTLSNSCIKFYFPNQGIKMLNNILQ